MLPKSLLSLQHPFVKYLVNLRKDRSFRRNERKVLAVGKKLIEELIESKAKIEILLVESGYETSFPYETLLVTHDILKKITGLIEPEPLAAIVSMPPFQDLSKTSYLLVLDGISDPGNLGTLLRTALALGWEGVYLTENTCDPFNEKAIRAAKGATFRIPLQEGSWEDLVLQTKSFTVFVADMNGDPIQTIIPKPPLALILSKEDRGARPEAKHQFQSVTIPMNGLMESLNVAAAGAILLHRLKAIQ